MRQEKVGNLSDATALRRGRSRWLLTEVVTFLVMRRARPVECSRFLLVADSVRHHGTSPWHLANRIGIVFGSCEHETPQGKPVVSTNGLNSQFMLYLQIPGALSSAARLDAKNLICYKKLLAPCA